MLLCSLPSKKELLLEWHSWKNPKNVVYGWSLRWSSIWHSSTYFTNLFLFSFRYSNRRFHFASGSGNSTFCQRRRSNSFNLYIRFGIRWTIQVLHLFLKNRIMIFSFSLGFTFDDYKKCFLYGKKIQRHINTNSF